MGLHPAPGALESDDFKLRRLGFSPEDRFVQLPEHRPMLRSHEIIDTAADGLVELVGLDQTQPGGIHRQESAIGGDLLHTFRL